MTPRSSEQSALDIASALRSGSWRCGPNQAYYKSVPDSAEFWSRLDVLQVRCEAG